MSGRRTAALAAGMLALLAAGAAAAPAQSVLGTSPNLRSVWALEAGAPAFVLGHRFELISGGDELINVPTLTLGVGLPWRLNAGLDFTSNSEIIPGRLGGNETQYWLGRSFPLVRRVAVDALVAWNSAAGSADAAVTGRFSLSSFTLLGEFRGFSDVFDTGTSGSAAAGGLIVHLTPHLQLSGDVGSMLSPDTLDTVWSAGLGISIPGTPHTFSLHATNGGATTLQGASRPKVLGPQAVRYGFTFTVPLGSRAQWARIFRRSEPTPALISGADTTVDIRMVAFTPAEVRIRAGQTVAWRNLDPIEHSVNATDGSWESAMLREGQSYSRTFPTPGRFEYYCAPHPQMRGVVIVEPR